MKLKKGGADYVRIYAITIIQSDDKSIHIVAKSDGEPPADMMAVYNYMHKKQIGRADKIRQMIAEYRNG